MRDTTPVKSNSSKLISAFDKGGKNQPAKLDIG